VGESTRTDVVRARLVRRWRLDVTSGSERGKSRVLEEGRFQIGSSEENDLVLSDPAISRRHLEIIVTLFGIRVRDLGSKNGTHFHGSRIDAADLPPAGGVLTLGGTDIAFSPADAPEELVASARERLGRMVARSEAMRFLFARIERVASSSATVLIYGETGTGKELVAEALHDAGARRDRPFEIVDCGAIPRDLIESELFGHVRGAFTNAIADRQGAFVRAQGGTLFLDEIAELELALQPKLLRALETGRVKPVGSDRAIEVDVRVIAASHRNLGVEVKEGRFREDLFYRLAVIPLEVPALRERREDVALLAEHFLAEAGASPLARSSVQLLEGYDWPGNVRQLRNVIERAVALAAGGPVSIAEADLSVPSSSLSPWQLLTKPYKQAKEELLSRFTQEYLEALLARHAGNVSAAAREAQVDRNWIVALARRHGVRIRD
jgi:DNA-binding NtrC family response regulator